MTMASSVSQKFEFSSSTTTRASDCGARRAHRARSKLWHGAAVEAFLGHEQTFDFGRLLILSAGELGRWAPVGTVPVAQSPMCSPRRGLHDSMLMACCRPCEQPEPRVKGVPADGSCWSSSSGRWPGVRVAALPERGPEGEAVSSHDAAMLLLNECTKACDRSGKKLGA